MFDIFRYLDRFYVKRHNQKKLAVVAFDRFLEGLPAGVQLFSLFEANPQLIDLLIDIVAISPDLARYLSRNSQVFDAVIGGDFFADWPGSGGARESVPNRRRADPSAA